MGIEMESVSHNRRSIGDLLEQIIGRENDNH